MPKELLDLDPNDTHSYLESLKEPTASQLRRLDIAGQGETLIPADELVDQVDLDGCVLARPGVVRSELAKVAMSPEGHVWEGPNGQ